MIAYLVKKVERFEQVFQRQLLNDFKKMLDQRDEVLGEREEHLITRLIENLDASRPSTPTPIPQEPLRQLVWPPSVQLVMMPPLLQQQQLQQPPGPYYHLGAGPVLTAPWQTTYPFNNFNSPPLAASAAAGTFTIQPLLNISPTHREHDLSAIKDAAHRIPYRDHSIAARISLAPQFRSWMASPGSRGLFAYYGSGTTSPLRVSALSLFCATLARAFEARDRHKYTVATFFCGLHIEDDDDDDDGNGTPVGIGAAAMARSIASQLLRGVNAGRPVTVEETRWDRRRGAPSGVDTDGVARGNVVQLCRLIVWLVHTQLSADQTFVCIVDGVGHYDTDELETDTLMVLKTLRWLARGTRGDDHGQGGGGQAAVKFLVTSTTAAHDVQALFVDEDEEEDGCFLSVVELPETNLGSSPRAPRSSRGRNILGGVHSDSDISESAGPDSEVSEDDGEGDYGDDDSE